MPDYSLEEQYDGLVAGVDEVGRGPLAGPVVAAAVVFRAPPSPLLSGLLDDSKKLTARRREKAYAALLEDDTVCAALGAASVPEIDRLNIGQACHLAMRRAMVRLAEALGEWPAVALIDGNRAPSLPCRVETVVKGDSRSFSIAAASILAKVVRDRLMTRLAMRHGNYGWDRNAGYGTAHHLTGLKEEGITLHHRRSFAPVRQMIAAKVHAA
ncbi:ribonuclease HII [Parasaccharibacter sp. TMW 2.1884]|uniref:ribonuclease HII n=1 Tax=Parasaccharibacter sp. TMW 2.1884 TaxID=2267834 RepID=UPI00131816D6|nr:ribonuclease HII [Parasaccharibacter sp. TMW 2.1884]MCL1512375.1 ribonuclease HII [Parasaccharibacter sp. TMW 2.1884]MUH03088.1 ribonuclease HII [Bombella sp. ESL0387]QGT75411.1 ribonuclease HII [Bombella sp. ESL0368]